MRQVYCPNCGSKHTFPVLETAWMRFCADCDEEWDIRPVEEINEE